MSQMSIDDLTEGERRRDAGMARVTEWSDERCIRAIDGAIRAFNEVGITWSANDLRASVSYSFPEIVAARPQLIGARVRAAAMRKEMTRVGYEPSTLPSTHAHPIAVWRGVAS